MAIQVSGTTVIDDNRNLTNVGGLKTVNGTSIVGSGNISAGGLEEVISINTISSAVSTFDVTWSNTGYQMIKLEFVDMLGSGNPARPLLRFSADGGSTYNSGSSNYKQAYFGHENAAVNVGSTYTYVNLGYGTTFEQSPDTSPNGGDYLNGLVTLLNPADTTKWTAFEIHAWATPSTNYRHWQTISGGLIGPNNDQTNGVRYYYTSGNVVAGTIRVIGVKR